ncbi:hypothetical protein FOA52_010225 [Chlamydomonas sp. UWO 241]|nr:hypothetical protein FOA52_010225 [Chlamydomonas sp. UWO 241]
MGDWEDDDWEAAAAAAPPPLKPPAAKSKDDKFADEDAGVEEPEEEKHVVVKSQPKKKEEKKWEQEEKAGRKEQDQPLDDPVSEKARQQRLVEQADFEAAKALFGESSGINLATFLPKTVKDFDDFATELIQRFVVPHKGSKNYAALVKALTRKACEPMSSGEIKEVESVVGVVRIDKEKAAKAEAAAKMKNAPKRSLNTGGKSGNSAGLDDYKYGDAGDGDDDFM